MTFALPTPAPSVARAACCDAPTWGNVHAVLMLTSTGLGVFLQLPALPTCLGIISLLVLVYRCRGAWTPDGRFGWANLVTSFRLLLTLVLVADAGELRRHIAAATALAILALDLLDGWLARRRGSQSAFGARYDMEVDALFVLSLSAALWAGGVGGLWVLLAGLWRYLFVVVPLIIPSRGGEAPRSLYYRFTYALMVVSFLLAWVAPPTAGRALCAAGTIILSLSFLRSFWYRYASPAGGASYG